MSEEPSSPPSSAASEHSKDIAFLVHSPETVLHNLPPDVDNKPLARQRRRRTSKEDEEVLKAEYKRNPKPDKTARMEIVSKVALGEKEVQIWFQNKRQNDRRRSRPADSSNSDIPSSSATVDMSSSTLEELSVHEDVSADETKDAPASTGPESAAKTDSQNTNVSITATETSSFDTAPTEPSSSQPLPPPTRDQPITRPTYLADRRSASFVKNEEEVAISILANASTNVQVQPTESRTMKRAHSFVRLSMTADGKARVITDADLSPSPPRPRPNPATLAGRAAGLRRSYSAAGFNDKLAEAAQERSPKTPRTSIGRSRDSRAWEFWCDPDSRNSLTTKAEQEGSGSAADAIGLIRANSRAALRANQNKRNTILGSTAGSGNNGLKKPRGPIQRASTTYGRLQSKTSVGEKFKGKQDENEGGFEIPQTESDKENWTPEPQVPGQRITRPNPPPSAGARRNRRILGENAEIMSQSNSLGSMLSRERRNKGEEQNKEGQANPEDDDELRAFMGSNENSEGTSISSGEELGCVEGLLALSQGNWR